MIRRFNHHSLMVLKACQKGKSSSTETNGGAGTQQQNGSHSSTTVNGESSQIHNSHMGDGTPPKKVSININLIIYDRNRYWGVSGDNSGIIILFLKTKTKNIVCWYSLGAPWWATSDKYPQHMFSFLTFIRLWADSADKLVIIFLFFLQNRIWRQFAWRVRSCFLGNIRKNVSKCCLLKCLPSMQSVNIWYEQCHEKRWLQAYENKDSDQPTMPQSLIRTLAIL